MQRKYIIPVALILVLGLGGWAADRLLKAREHPGLLTFLQQWWVNYPASFAVEPLELTLRVSERDLDALEEVVEAARARGVIMPEGNDYIPAELEFDGATFKARVRIKGKMYDHVKGSKWSFRVIAKKDKGFLGMQRFSLQHPGTRNYLCDWFYHRLMKGEGVIALRYGFIRLRFNEEDLGVYAYEEHFGPELLANNGRTRGPLFRFDPSLFWEHRLNMLQDVRYNEAFGAYQAAAVDAFGSGDLEEDSVQRHQFEEAVGLMDAFRRGDLAASRVFDADRLGRRHAILDLVGGHHSMDWSDVKFYYDPILRRIEPVAYESFSAFPIRTLAGSHRYVGRQDASMDLHDAYFNDPEVFRAYVHHLERLSRASYLDSAFATLGPALDSASAVIYREFPYKELDRSIYYRNQTIIRRMLDVPKGFHAYFNGGVDTLRFTIVPIEGLPMEVHGLVGSQGRTYRPMGPVIVPCRPAAGMGTPMDIKIPVDGTFRIADGKPMILRYSVLGASVMKELEVFPYAYLDGLTVPSMLPWPGDTTLPAFVSVDRVDRIIHIHPGSHVLEKDLFLPAGYTVRAAAPLRLDLRSGSRIISRSPMHLTGSEEVPIVVTSSDSSGGYVMLTGTGGRSRFRKVRFAGFGKPASTDASIILHGADADLEACDMGELRGRDLLMAVRSDVSFSACRFTGGTDQVTLAYCRSKITGSTFLGAGDDAISVKGGSFMAERTGIDGALGSGVKVDELAEARTKDLVVACARNAVSISEGAKVRIEGGKLSATQGSAIDVDRVHMRHGPSDVEVIGVEMTGSAQRLKIGPGNKVRVDGKAVEGSGTVSP